MFEIYEMWKKLNRVEKKQYKKPETMNNILLIHKKKTKMFHLIEHQIFTNEKRIAVYVGIARNLYILLQISLHNYI